MAYDCAGVERMGSVPKSEAVWLGPGEFTHPDKVEARERARTRFLQAIQEEAPDVLAELANEPLALFRPLWRLSVDALSEEQREEALFRFISDDTFTWDRFKYPDSDYDPVAADAAALGHRLNSWARQWNLDQSADDWVMEQALATLRWWCAFPPSLFDPDELKWAMHLEFTLTELAVDEMTIALPQRRWNPQSERKSQARERIWNDLQSRLTEELDRIEAIADERLLATQKLTSGDAHFRWLVHYQVLELKWTEVAERAGRASHKQVREAVHALAPEIGIALRPGKPGRPRSTPLSEARPRRGGGSRILRRDLPQTSTTDN
jgi:hypothetical protein